MALRSTGEDRPQPGSAVHLRSPTAGDQRCRRADPQRLDDARRPHGAEGRTTKKLGLSCARNGEGVVAFLATCRAFPELVELRVGWISDVGAETLAPKAVGLDRLAEIYLGEITTDRPCVTDAGVRALARSPHLPGLRRIERRQTHNVYAPDARDDTETALIERDDGTIVESILEHSLWP